MSQKTHKKRKNHSHDVGKNPGILQQTESTKRFNPKARNLLYLDLVFLAICMLLDRQKMLSPEVSGACTIIGTVLLFVALYFQFVQKDGNDKGRL